MINILVYDKCQCDPRKCTAKRMVKFGLAEERNLRRIPAGSLVLSPFGDRVLSPADLRHARRGLAVMDLTWTNIDDFPHIRGEKARRLPYLVAANPVNYGRPWKLNSAEAVLASLIIMGQDKQAELFTTRFNWAPTFIALNRELLEAYRAAGNAEGVQKVSDEYVESVTEGERTPSCVPPLET